MTTQKESWLGLVLLALDVVGECRFSELQLARIVALWWFVRLLSLLNSSTLVSLKVSTECPQFAGKSWTGPYDQVAGTCFMVPAKDKDDVAIENNFPWKEIILRVNIYLGAAKGSFQRLNSSNDCVCPYVPTEVSKQKIYTTRIKVSSTKKTSLLTGKSKSNQIAYTGSFSIFQTISKKRMPWTSYVKAS